MWFFSKLFWKKEELSQEELNKIIEERTKKSDIKKQKK